MPWQPKCAVSVVASRRFERGKSEMQTKTTIVAVAAAYFLCANAVLAHDEAQWIERNPNYTSQTGQHCCGPKDCSRISADLVYEDGNVITLFSTQQKFRRGTKGTYLSETDDWWICTGRQFPGFHAPQAICLFYPFHSQ